jgi:hypothetical protein
MDNDSLVNSNDAKNMMILDFQREASSEAIIRFLALLQTTMGVQTSLTNFRGRVKFTRAVDATLINAVAESGKGIVKFVRQQAQQQHQKNSTSEEADILPKEKATPELLLLTGTAGILPIEHVQAILQHILPKAPMSSIKAHNGRTASDSAKNLSPRKYSRNATSRKKNSAAALSDMVAAQGHYSRTS